MSAYGTECCERKVDVITLVTVIGAIAALSLFLRQAVIDNMITGGKKKRSLNFIDYIFLGMFVFLV